jgi:hypothetical protein
MWFAGAEQTAAISELLDTMPQEELRQLLTDEYGEAPGDDEDDESVEDEESQMPQPVLLTFGSPPPVPPVPPVPPAPPVPPLSAA